MVELTFGRTQIRWLRPGDAPNSLQRYANYVRLPLKMIQNYSLNIRGGDIRQPRHEVRRRQDGAQPPDRPPLQILS